MSGPGASRDPNHAVAASDAKRACAAGCAHCASNANDAIAAKGVGTARADDANCASETNGGAIAANCADIANDSGTTNGSGANNRHPLHQMAVENLTVTRGGRTLIENVSFQIHCGDMVALIGPNGGGKSTLLKAIIGEIPHEGNVRFGDAGGKGVQRPRIGYMPQHMLFDRQSPLTVADFLAAARTRRPVFLGLSRHRREHVRRLLEQVEGAHLIDQRLGDLSGGELQRVSLAFALDPIPDVLLLDEPVAALDKTGRALFYKLVQDLRDRFDLLTLIVTHDLGVINQYATHAYYLNQTIRAGGPVSQLAADPQTAPYFAALDEEI